MDPRVQTLLQRLSNLARTQIDPRVSYTDAGGWIGEPAKSLVLDEALDGLVRLNHGSGDPLLSALVVHNENGTLGLPGVGFWKAAQGAGAQPQGQDNLRFWIDQFNAIHGHWFGK